MKPRAKLIAWLKAALLGAFLLTPQTAPTQPPQGPPVIGSERARKGGTFRYNIRAAPVTLNPLTAHDNYSLVAMRWMVESLLNRHEDTYEWVPHLAEKYEVSRDLTVLTFDLRKGVKFHDGSEMTADDVEFSFKVFKLGLYDTLAESTELENLDKIEVLDKYKIRFTMKRPNFDNLSKIAMRPILPKAVYGKKENVKQMNKTVVGTGPYRLKEYQVGHRLVLDANKDWWGRSVPFFKNKFNFAQIIARFALEQEVLLLMLEKGEFDYADIAQASYSKRTKAPPWGKTVLAKQTRYAAVFTQQQACFWNLRLPVFRGRDTRRALQLLFNRQWINEKTRDGTAVLATGPWHRLSEYADPTLKPDGYDPQEAARLLKKDGWADADKDGALEKTIDGKKTDFKFTVLIPLRNLEGPMTTYQEDLKKLGIKLEILFADWTLFMKRLDAHDFEAYIVGRGWPNVVDFNPKALFLSKNAVKGGDNPIGFQNTKVDELLEKAEVEMDRAKRIEILRQVYRIMAEEHAHLFWFSEPEFYYAHSSRVKMEKPFYKYLQGLDYWWIEE